MKNSFKKIISLVLTVLMLAGTVTMLVPITASAADDYVTITPNSDFEYNGVTYRFDVQSGNTESYAHILADGSVEFKLADGDIIWFPDVQATDSSAIHAKVTAIDRTTVNNDGGMANLFAGLIYGYNGTTETGVGAIIKTAKNYRITNITRSKLAGDNGANGDGTGDGYGNGGDKRMKDGTASSQAGVYDSNANNWYFGTTITFDISRTTDNVTVVLSGSTKFAEHSYAATDGYSFAGAVGFAPVWSKYDESRYSTFRFDELTLTNCTVNEESKDSYTVLDRTPILPEAPEGTIYLQKNTTATINGVTYRFDSDTDKNPDSWARVNPDGTWEMSFRTGDTLWFPDVSLTSDSKIHAEITNTGTRPQNTSFSGLAYGITADENGRYSQEMVAAMCTGSSTNGGRFRITRATYAGNYTYADGYCGNGGHERITVWGKDFADTWKNSSAWTDIADDSHNLKFGGTVSFDVEKTSEGDISVSFGAGESTFLTKKYNDNTSFESKTGDVHCPYEDGAVGVSSVYATKGGLYTQYRIEDIIITNCEVDGAAKNSYSVKAVKTGVENAKISLSLDGTIGLNFAFNASNMADATVVATKNGVEVVNQPVVNGENLVTVPVNAKEMTDTINISIMLDGEVFDGKTYTVSVEYYAQQLLNDEDWGDLMSAMLNYGAAAQKLLNYKAAEADVSGVGSAGEILSTVSDVKFDDKIGDVLKGLYMNLSLESDTVLNLYFMPADEVELSVKVNDKDAELTANDDGYYVLSIEGIAADKLSEDFTIVVNDTSIFKVNALNWAKLASSDADENVATLAKALAIYSSCADEVLPKN
ncbi:MAG: hypothetical protein IJZ83_08505 [Clostridia bacterium]|nr:hypothetical protein [Clostridia bacterium]